MNSKNLQNQKTYDENASEFHRKFTTSGIIKDEIDLLFSFCPKEKPSILELGCAGGRDAAYLIPKSGKYIGIDISPKFIEIAKNSFPDNHFEVADIETYQFPENIDIIFAAATLLHTDWQHFSDILNKAYQSLNPKGLFYFSLKQGPYQEFIKNDEHGQRFFYYYEPEDICQLAGSKFSIIHQNSAHIRNQQWLSSILQKNVT